MKQVANNVLRLGVFLALVLAGCGVKKSDKYNPANPEVAHIYFGKSDMRLDANDKQALDDLAQAFKQEQVKTKVPLAVMLTAHTSNDGTLAANKKVAAKRAKHVADYLKSKHNLEVVVHALDDPRCGEGAASRLVVARICAKSDCAAHQAAKPAKKNDASKKDAKKEKTKISTPAVAPVVAPAA